MDRQDGPGLMSSVGSQVTVHPRTWTPDSSHVLPTETEHVPRCARIPRKGRHAGRRRAPESPAGL